MPARVDVTSRSPTVEYRPGLNLYFIVFDELRLELAPAFAHKITAHEIAINCYYGVPFFTMIPTVPYGTPYPRHGLLMPRIHPVEIPLRIR